ncbi:MAG: amino acid permease [Bacteriovoracaceae bacterium]|nr:amino acid permease [Bacteriovoracaceae bacterium]
MKKLERRLGLGAVVSISVSAMLGSGIFVLPGIAATTTGPSVWLAYILASLSVLPAALSKSELATAMPTSGGTYVYLERTFGPIVGTISGLGLWLSLLLKATFALMGFGAYLKVLAPQVELVPTSLSILAFICILNILGVGKVSGILMAVVGLCIALLTGISVGAVFSFDASLLDPLFPGGISGLASATALVFVSYAGVTKVAAIAEEIKEPERNLPRGIMISLLIVTLVYSGVTFLLFGNLPIGQISNNLRPIYTLALHISGPFLGSVTAVIAVLTMSSMANSGILAASRFPFAMARDKLLPSPLGRLNRKYLTPVWSIIISGLVMSFVLLNMDVTKIAKFASAFMILIYMAENISVIVLREARVQWYKPEYKSPFYPYVQIIGIILNIILLSYMGPRLVASAILSISIPGLVIFILYSRKNTTRKGVIGIRGKRQDLVEEVVEVLPRTRLEDMDLSVDANVVVTLFGRERSPEMLIEMGVALAEHGNCEVAHITEVPEQTDLDDLMDEPAELRSLRRRVVAMAVEKKEPITFDPVVSHDLARTVFHISQRLHCQWLLIEWRGKTAGAFTIHNPMGWLKGHLRCNLGIFRDAGVRYIRKIICYVRGNDTDSIVISTADHLAEVNRADITLLSLLPEDSTEEVLQRTERDLKELAKTCISRTNVLLLQSNNAIDTVIAQTVEFDLFIFGGTQHTFVSNLFGSEDDRLLAKAACSVISVQSAPSHLDEDKIKDYFV